ncbi:MAG TPA: YvrJ family protein [Patescibacteria group bacterium]|nr:YvrJ family protein [Patescibacteria group bacterium]
MDIVTIIGQVGFPIAVAAYLLVKFENKLDAFTQAANNLAIKLEAHTDRCLKCREGRPCSACDKN